NHFAGADTKHYVMRIVIAAPEKMHIVCGNQTEAEIFRELWQHRVAPFLFLHSVIVHFDEEILRAENVAIFGGGLPGDVGLVCLERGIDFAGETTTEPDQSFGMLGE